MDEKRWNELKEKERLLRKAAKALRVSEEELPNVVKRFLKEIEERKTVIEKLHELKREVQQ